MQRLGLIGGSGWPSTLEYYRILNTCFGQERGGAHALDMILRNLDFEIFRELLEKGYRQEAIQMLIDGVNDCKKAGAAIAKTHVQTIGLIGVRATMESDFFQDGALYWTRTSDPYHVKVVL